MKRMKLIDLGNGWVKCPKCGHFYRKRVDSPRRCPETDCGYRFKRM